MSVFFRVRYLGSEIDGLYGSFSPNFLRHLHSVLQSGCINLHSHKLYKRVLFYLLQHLLVVDFLMMDFLASVR